MCIKMKQAWLREPLLFLFLKMTFSWGTLCVLA